MEVQRLLPLLRQRGVRYVVYNAVSESGDGRDVIPVCRRRWIWTAKYMLTGREPAVYLMSGRLVIWILGALTASLRGKRVMVQLRNSALPDWIADSWWHRRWAGFALRRMSRVICVSKLLVNAAREIGVDPRRIHWSPAFLPPDLTPEGRDDVAPEVWSFVDSHRPLIAANGKVLWYRGEDLYGLDHLVDLAARLKSTYAKIGLVVCFWDHKKEDEIYLERLRHVAAAKGVADSILFNTRSGAFVPVLRAADLLARPTNTDGDAVSVREALHLGIPAVASDAVERPAGTILFRTRDLDDFEAKVRSVLARSKDGTVRSAPKLSEEDRDRIASYVDLLAAVAEGRETAGDETGARGCREEHA